jgi:hypothetical protein
LIIVSIPLTPLILTRQLDFPIGETALRKFDKADALRSSQRRAFN